MIEYWDLKYISRWETYSLNVDVDGGGCLISILWFEFLDQLAKLNLIDWFGDGRFGIILL